MPQQHLSTSERLSFDGSPSLPLLLPSLFIVCALCVPASAAPAAGTYELSYDTTHERFDRHTLATSTHRGTLQLKLASGGAAALRLADQWSYHSSSDHGVRGGRLYIVDRNISSKIAWGGRWRSLPSGGVAFALTVTTARCEAGGRRHRRHGGGKITITCEQRPALALRCVRAKERAYPAASARARADRSKVGAKEQRRAVSVLRWRPQAGPLPKLLAPMAMRKSALTLTSRRPLSLFRRRASNGKVTTLLRH